MRGWSPPGLRVTLVGLTLLAATTACSPARSVPATGDQDFTAAGPDRDAQPRPASKLGIGFLWTDQARKPAQRLTEDRDFVDLILGRGKLDVFEQVKPPVRVVCLARSLERNAARPFPGLKETLETLQTAAIKPERVIIGYNPERQPGTPTREMDDLLASVRRARDMVARYGAPLLVAPGLRYMEGRDELYVELAPCCDIWMIQSQRLQIDPATREAFTPAEYATKVRRIVELLRQGNPRIRIFVQIVAGRDAQHPRFTADEVVAYARSIEDWVESVRIYGASGELLNQIIDRLRGPESGAR